MDAPRYIKSSDFKKIVTKEIAPYLRKLGWKGSGYDYTRTKYNIGNSIKFQGSSGGEKFCINLLVHFVFEPLEYGELIQELNKWNFGTRLMKHKHIGNDWWNYPIKGSNYDELIQDVKDAFNSNLELFFDKYENWEDKILGTTVDRLKAGELKKILLGTDMTQALICSVFNLNNGKKQAAIDFARFGETCIEGIVGSGRKGVIDEIIKEASS